MKNCDFNVLNQLIQEEKSFWRIENHYIGEARDDEEKELWESIRDIKLEQIAILTKMTKKCL
ncbi:hypothetical protein KC901_00885 [Patescibacteria group bacterium]|nr:hypothetical protein [Patescibacteria group bacterium]